MGNEFNGVRFGDETVTFTRPDKTVKVYRLSSTPAFGLKVEVLTEKEAAIEEIKAQPFYVPNASGKPPAANEPNKGNEC
jgi:hypothetical protein